MITSRTAIAASVDQNTVQLKSNIAFSPQTGFSSVRTYLLPSTKVIVIEFFSTEISEQLASEKLRWNLSDAQILTYPLSRATKSISALISRTSLTDAEDGLGRIVHLKGAWKALQLSNFDSASSDELTFLSCLVTLGPERAIVLAAKHGWRCLRPLLALLLATNARGRNYSGKNAKRKPPSGSPASSRKRSSNG